MVTMTGVYEGDKHCEITHGPSGNIIQTDAPKDNNGRGEAFSPTDMVGAALGSCILTTMAIWGEKSGMSIKGASFSSDQKNENGTKANRRTGRRNNATSDFKCTGESNFRKNCLHLSGHKKFKS